MFDEFIVTRWSLGRQIICGGLATLFVISYIGNLISPPADGPLEFSSLVAALVFIYLAGVFYKRDGADNGSAGYVDDDHDRQIAKLQRQLSNDAFSMSQAEARGDHATAARLRGMILETESKLRRLGA